MSDYRVFFLIIVTALIFDLLLQTPFIIALITLLCYVLWLIYSIQKLEEFFGNIESKHAPDSQGKLGSIVRNIINLNKKIKQERSRSQRIITRLNEVLRNFPYPTIMLNQYGKITWMDRSAAKLFKLRRKADVGLKLNNLLRNTSLGELLQRPEPAELSIISPQNNDNTLLLSLSKLANETRIITIMDISTRVKLLNTQREFISNASHELRTPLTVINGYLEALSLDIQLNEHHKVMIHEAHDQAKLMSGVITDLLDLSTIENEHAKFSTIVIAEVIERVCAECRAYQGTRTIDVEVGSELTLVTSFYQLYTLIKNLIDNAIKYSDEDAQISIIVSFDPTISISVSDTGIGIPEHQIEHITEPFYRVESSYPGSGLGLNIVQKITQANNAKLAISSTVGEGSVFTVTFP